jgi:hypothetical protein
MSDDDRPTEGKDEAAPLADLIQGLSTKLDTVAGATAAVASTQTDLLTRMAEAEVRRSEDASNVAQRLDALERQVLAALRQRLPGAAILIVTHRPNELCDGRVVRLMGGRIVSAAVPATDATGRAAEIA